MATWNTAPDELHIDVDKGGGGCVVIFFVLIGLVVMAGSISSLASDYPDVDFDSSTRFALIFAMFGSVLIVAGLSMRSMNYNSTVVINTKREEISFSRGEQNDNVIFGLGDIAYARLLKVFKRRSGSTSNSGSRRYATYQIFLVKKDGAHLWLDTFHKRGALEKAVSLLHESVGIQIVDDTSSSLSRDATKTFTNQLTTPPASASKFVTVGSTRSGKEIVIKEKTTLLKATFFVNVFAIFTLIPVIIFISAFDKVSFERVIILTLFGACWFAAIFIMLLSRLRTYRLAVTANGLTISLNFPTFLLNSIFGKTIDIPSSSIAHVRTNRLDEGHFWLSLTTDRPYLGGSLSNLLFNVGAFSKNKMRELNEQEHVISLWEVYGYTAKDQGADLNDLLYIEHLIQSYLGLSEENIPDA